MNSPFVPFREAGYPGPGKPATSTLGFQRIRNPLQPFGDAPDGGWPAANDPTSATATPDYDNWGFDTWWTASDWMTWHMALKRAYGLEEANRRFITAWDKQGLFASPIDARSFDTTFRQYARDNGFFDALFSGIGGLVGRLPSTGTDVVVGATGAVSNVGQAVGTIGSMAKYILPVAALAFGYYYFMAYKPSRR
jgi:hypothetical protein